MPSRARPENVFLLLALIFGLELLALNPPFQAPDEPEHFFRAVQLSDGTLIGERHGLSAGGPIPVAIDAVASTEGIAFHPERKMTAEMFARKAEPVRHDWYGEAFRYCHFPHTVLYPPVGYAPQATAIVLGKLAHFGPLLLLYAARLATFGIALLLGWATLRRRSRFRWSSLLLLTMPMSLYLMGSVASDALLIGAGFLLAALVDTADDVQQPPGTRELAQVLACAVLLASKIVYLPLAVGAVVLICRRIPNGRARLLFCGLFALTSVAPAAFWTLRMRELYVPGRSDIPIDAFAQSHQLLAHPFAFLKVVGVSLQASGVELCDSFVGLLGWGDTPMPHGYYGAFGLALGSCIIAELGVRRVRAWTTVAIPLASAIAAVLLVFASQYAVWNSPGSPGPIQGVTGRYFIPIAPFFLLAIPFRHRNPGRACAVGATAAATAGCAVALFAVLRRYYVG